MKTALRQKNNPLFFGRKGEQSETHREKKNTKSFRNGEKEAERTKQATPTTEERRIFFFVSEL